MKLYFYIFKKSYRNKPYVQFAECEVEEKPKTYRPIDEFPNGYWGCFVRKEDIGHLCGYENNVVILTEKNKALAKEIFSNYFAGIIKRLQNETSEYQELLNVVAELED